MLLRMTQQRRILLAESATLNTSDEMTYRILASKIKGLIELQCPALLSAIDAAPALSQATVTASHGKLEIICPTFLAIKAIDPLPFVHMWRVRCRCWSRSRSRNRSGGNSAREVIFIPLWTGACTHRFPLKAAQVAEFVFADTARAVSDMVEMHQSGTYVI